MPSQATRPDVQSEDLPTSEPRIGPFQNGVRKRSPKGEHVVRISETTQASTTSGPLSGKDFAEKINELKTQASVAIDNFCADNDPDHYKEDRIEQVIKAIDEFPNGYPKLAALESCDDNFLIFKEYRWLSSRVLLDLQDELAVQVEELTALDKYDDTHDPMRLASRRRDVSLDKKRKELLSKVEEKLDRFYKLLLRTHQLARLDKPSYRNQRSLFNAIHATGSQIQSESEWIGDREDLVAVAPGQEHGILNVAVEEGTSFISKSIAAYLFQTPEQRRRAGKENVTLYSQQRLDAIANALTTLIATLMLLIPIGILSLTNARGVIQLLVILVFTQLFGLCIAIFTKARKHEFFGATAAYAAVLVVFLANNNSCDLVTTNP